MVLAHMRTPSRLRLLVAMGGLLASLCAAQSLATSGPGATAGKDRYTVAGSVSNSVTGEPIRRALVHIGQFAVFTGADGRFQMDGVIPGLYNATAQRPGFVDPTQTGQMSSPPPMINVGPNTPPVTLKLAPESVVEGRVLSNTGEPIENAQVQLLQEQIFNGRKMLQPTGNDETDDAGDFRIENLIPGKYYVRVLQKPVFGWAIALASGAASRQAYPEQFYPNAPDLASAQALELKPGESARVDFTLAPKPAFRISGVVVPAVSNGIFASLRNASGDETHVGVRVNPRTGRWMLPFVPPGAWTIVFRAQNQPGDAYYGEQHIDVRGSDIGNVQIVLQPLPPILVQVMNGSDPTSQNVQVRLIQPNTRLNRQEFMATPYSSGALAIRDVLPGTYSVAVQSNGQGCIDSVSTGSIDLMHDPLVVSAGSPPPPIQVALRADCATLNVKVESQDRTAAVLLASDSAGFEPKIGWTLGNSTFSFGGLTPGVYRLYAIPNPNKLEYANPDALRNLDGQEITLAPNQQATASVTVAGSAPNQ